MQSPSLKKKLALKALILELGIAVVGTILIVIVLLSFNIIDISKLSSSLTSNQKNQDFTNINPTITITPVPVKSSPATLLEYLNSKKALRTAYTVVEIEGIISDINFSGGVSKFDHIPYKISITLLFGESNDQVPIYYTEKQLDKIKVYDKNNNLISLEGLKVGEKITIKETTNLLIPTPPDTFTNPENLIESVITIQ